MPALHRPGLAAGDRPGPARPRPDALDRRRRARALVGRQLGLLRVGDPGDRGPLRDRPGGALGDADRGCSRTSSSTARTAIASTSSTATGWGGAARTCSPSRASSRASSGATARPTRRSMRERIEEYMSFRPCPACGGARLRPEVLAVTVGGTQHPRVHAACRSHARSSSSDGLELSETEQLIGDRIVKEIRERLTLPRQRRRRLPARSTARRPRSRAARRSGSGSPTQIGSQLVGVLYILDEPSIGLHQRDNGKLHRDARTAARPRQHGARRRARRADDALRRLARGHGAGRGRARRPRRRGGHRRRRSSGVRGLDHRPVPLGRALDRGAASGAIRGSGSFCVRGAREHNLKDDRRRVPARRASSP